MKNYSALFDAVTNADSSTPPQGVEEPAAPPLAIRNIRDLIGTLSSPDAATRLRALKALQLQPQAALALGLYQGMDVIDILLSYVLNVADNIEWMNWVATLSAFRSPRVTEFFLDTLTNDESPHMLFVAARHLSAGDVTPLPWRLMPFLLQNEHPLRARAIAPLLHRSPFLTDAARLRAVLLATELDEGNESLLFNSATAELWLAELAGPFQPEARIRLKAQGETVWASLGLRWNQLDESNQLWLLEWGNQRFGEMVAELLPEALRSNSPGVRILGLEIVATLKGKIPEPVTALATGLLKDADAQVRAAAVSAGPSTVDWRTFLAEETVPAVRRACIAQMARSEGKGAIPELVGFLRSDDWQMRAVAADTLTQLGRPAAELMKRLVHDEDERVRIAAARVLVGLQEDEWLKNEFQLNAGYLNNSPR